MSQSVGTCSANIGCLTAGGPVNGQWLTGANIGNGCQTTYHTYGKTSDMMIPGPSMLWVFCDEHPDSINDAMVAVQLARIGPFATIIDYPASYHNAACGFAFADGHAEIHKWVGKGIQFPVSWSSGNFASGSHAANDSFPDVAWLQQRTSY